MASKDKSNLYVLGIGASAGGLDALSKFLGQFNGIDFELCVVVVMHLSPKYKSELAAILNKRCKWPVITAEHNQKLEAFKVYVAPPNHQIVISKDQLILEEMSDEYQSTPSVDHFLTSLAKAKKRKAIGIVLSGFGEDGSKGIKDIKRNYGFTLAQLPETAEYKNMPMAAIETDSVDAIVPAEQMFDEIVHFITNSKTIASTETKQNTIDSIFELLEKRSGTNFSMYKPSTIMRRITYRINALRLKSITEYYELIKENPRELDVLFDTVLIGVTEFFRDQEAFDELRKQLEILIKEKEFGDSLRIWSVGCATGEEPYSLAILLHEILGPEIVNYHIQIFASDIDEKAINYGRKAVYHKDSLENLPQEWIDKYFEQKNSIHYELTKEIKQHILFTRHDITNDPPFVKLDLIVCRNLLIYFNNTLQKQSFQIFHYSLRPKGLMFLGKSESVSVAANLFKKVNKFKIYRKADTSIGYQLKFSRYRNKMGTRDEVEDQGMKGNTRNMSIIDIAKETLYYKYEHPFVIVDEHSDIKEVHGSLRLYMEISQGAINFNLAKMVNPELTSEVKALQAQVRKTGVAHTSHIIRFKLYDQEHFVRLKMIPLVYRINDSQYFIVIFEKIDPETRNLELYDKLETMDYENLRIKVLEDELASTKEHLQIFTEELESTNEELQTINEELQSANEELKSSNEELETSNEELQSANEELNTANQELRLKNDLLIEKEKELKEEKSVSEKNESIYRTIAENIPNGTVCILNEKLEIEYIAGQGLTDFKAEDIIGKYMPHLNPKKKEAERLEKICKATLQGEKGRIEISFKDRFYEIRTQLFDYPFTDGKKIFYLTQEITEAKRSQRILETALEAAEMVVFEYRYEEDKFVNNKRLAQFLGYSHNKTIKDKDFQDRIHPDDLEKRNQEMKNALETGHLNHELRLVVDDKIKYVRLKGAIISDDFDKPIICVASIYDITKDKDYLYRLEESEKRFKTIANTAPITIWISDKNKDCLYVNKNWLDYTGSTFEDNLGDKWVQFIHPDDRKQAKESHDIASENKEAYSVEYRVRRFDGTYKWFYNHGVPNFDSDGNFNGFFGSNFDMNDKIEFTNKLEKSVKERTQELVDANETLMKLNLNLEEFAYMASHDLKEPLRKIRTFNSLVSSNDEDQQVISKYTNKIEQSADRMSRLIDSILDYSRIEEQLSKDDQINLDEILNDVIADLTLLIEDRNVNIIESDLGEVHGVPIRIYQLFSNLIRNAIKFNTNDPIIEIRSEIIDASKLSQIILNPKSLSYKKISFTDNGIGIEPDKRDYIFKPFKRLNPKDKYPGTGIGLAICKKIMDLHNGFIDIESNEKGGSVFSLYFPLS
ncbi:MAG: hypothetical protein CL613_01915 [Aquimarina sp.]|nr:hypothetical protein [Aquimarina sp.]